VTGGRELARLLRQGLAQKYSELAVFKGFSPTEKKWLDILHEMGLEDVDERIRHQYYQQVVAMRPAADEKDYDHTLSYRAQLYAMAKIVATWTGMEEDIRQRLSGILSALNATHEARAEDEI